MKLEVGLVIFCLVVAAIGVIAMAMCNLLFVGQIASDQDSAQEERTIDCTVKLHQLKP